MKIKWLGHASFVITSDKGLRILTDPYETGGDLTYGEIKESADIVTVSHEHADHNNVSAVEGSPEVVRGAAKGRVKGIEFNSISTYHDDAQGRSRGENTIFCFKVDGVRICHLGDLGHQLSDEQIAELGKVDVLLIPIGGFYTIGAKVASQLCDKLMPKVVIPMHYKTSKCSFPITGVDEFLRGKERVTRLNTSEVELKQGQLPESTQIIVLKSAL